MLWNENWKVGGKMGSKPRSGYIQIHVIMDRAVARCRCMSHIMKKPAFQGYVQVRLKKACSSTEAGNSLVILDKSPIGIILSGANNKDNGQTLQMCRLLCFFVICIRHNRFSHDRSTGFSLHKSGFLKMAEMLMCVKF